MKVLVGRADVKEIRGLNDLGLPDGVPPLILKSGGTIADRAKTGQEIG